MRYLDKFLVFAETGHRQQLGLSLQDFQTLVQKIGTENCCLTWSTKNVCKNASSQTFGLFRRFCWNHSPLFTTSLLPSTCGSLHPIVFPEIFFHTLCSRLEKFSTAKNLSNLGCSRFEHFSTCAFCRWVDIFTQKGNCSSPKNLGKSPNSNKNVS